MSRLRITASVPFAACVAALAAEVRGQAPGVAIEPERMRMGEAGVARAAEALRTAGKLMSREQVAEAIKSPKPERLTLPAALTERLEPRAVADRARKALVRIGWYYRCMNCDRWHLNLAGGYAVTADGVIATCRHCIDASRQEMREGHLIAVDADGRAYAVTAVLASDAELDAALLRVAGTFQPLALNERSAPGDPVYLFSDPLGVRGYFTTGVLNRFYWMNGAGGDPETLAGVRRMRINVGTDWAPGSSGAAVLDNCGNAVGHVAAIQPLVEADHHPGAASADPKQPKTAAPAPAPAPARGTLIVLHQAIPARGVRLLAASMNPAK